MPSLPERTRVLRNHHLDSTRWDAFRPREGDVIVATSYKAGTTWTQAIVAHLLFPEGFPAPPWELSPWLDFRAAPLDEVMAGLEAQTHRRFIKTHLPLDALPFFPEARYIFVSRDGRDVALSLWNHYRNYTEESRARINGGADRAGDPLPPPPDSFGAFWRDWCTRGWDPEDGDGWPFWSHLGVTQSWWDWRHLPNILALHYSDMKRDPAGSVRRIAAHIGVELSEARLAEVVSATDFEAMKRRGADYAPRGGATWKGGADTFLHKGETGRWRGAIPEADLALYDAACARALSPDCRAWLEAGEGG